MSNLHSLTLSMHIPTIETKMNIQLCERYCRQDCFLLVLCHVKSMFLLKKLKQLLLYRNFLIYIPYGHIRILKTDSNNRN